ncbi:MAG: UvrD-helicase domain-containing protein [Chloroflexi bacterium]|nr:UvrD-helicase domain-containing protein [Chloroflexota bacterium]
MPVDVLEGLNSAQREAVETTEGPLLIVAGPGSGKTRVITHRIAYLVRVCGVSPYRIAAVTFTNKAAKEMRDRLQRLLGARGQGLTCGTFHAFCATVLRRDGRPVGLEPNFVIYDEEDQVDLLKRTMEAAEVDSNRYPVRGVQSAISGAKSVLLDPGGYAARATSPYEKVVARVYERYQHLLARNQAADFDDLLLKTVHLFQQAPEALAKYQSRYVHLLVDEFQDTNVAQYALARLLASQHRNICVVGDPDQSIYSWRHADIRNILSFRRDYPDAKMVSLAENYRSTKTIVAVAKHLILPNRSRVEKDLYTRRELGPPVAVHEAFNEEEEAVWVVQEVDRLVRQDKARRSECAVMYRTNAQSRAFEEACLRYGIPYQLIGGVRFYQRREVKDIIAYLRMVHNPDDEVSLRRVINVPPRGIGARTLDEAARWAQAASLPLHGALEALACQEGDGPSGAAPPLGTRARAAVQGFLQLLERLRQEAKSLGVAGLLDRAVELTGYRRYLLEGEERGEEQWENVLELRGQAKDLEESVPAAEGLARFLERVALVADVDNLDESKDALTLITLHQAKGLEFPVVFIAGLEEGLLPHVRSLDDPEALEEERRLCYVGVTRAKERLYLLRAFRRHIMGSTKPATPSRFLMDVPAEFILAAPRMAPDGWMKQAPGPAAAAPTGGPLPFRAGDKVRHGKFGDGIVVNCVPSDADHEVTVAFRGDAGVKRLLASYARLEKLA